MKNILIATILLSSFCLNAQDTTKLKVSGYIDTYYSYDFKNKEAGDKPSFFYSQKRNNEFNVNLALVKFTYDTDKIRTNLTLQAGNYATYNYAAESEVMKHVYQASIGFKLKKNLWIDAGILPSHIGAETAIHKDNLALTRAVMAENVPFYQSGARLSYEGSKLTAQLLLVNGWQNIKETNSDKAIGSFLGYKISDKVSINHATFVGNEMNDTIKKQYRFYQDMYSVITLKFIDIIPSAQLGIQNKNIQYGASFTTRLHVTPKLSFTGRVEMYNDKYDILTSAGSLDLYGSSLGINYNINDNILFRTEGKILSYNNLVNQLITTSICASF